MPEVRVSVYIPLLVAILLAAGSPVLATRLPPAVAARMLTGSAILAALASSWALVLLAGTLFGQQDQVARRAHWSARVLRTVDPVPRVVAVLAALALLTICGRTLRALARHAHAWHAARALCAGTVSELLVLEQAAPQAFAVPGRHPRIAVSTGMLHALDAPERRVLFAHERSHLRHRHDRYLLAGALAEALNPLLIRHRRDIAYVCERWADEDACTAVKSRPLAARALARAAVAALAPAAATLGFERLRVPHRLAALHAPRPAARPLLTAAYAACAAVPVIAVADATLAMARLLHAASH